MFEVRDDRLHMGADLLRGPRFGRHVRDAEVDELLHALVGKGAAVVAPLAVVLVEGTVRLTAQGAVVERHAAALADELTRGAKQGIDGHVEKGGTAVLAFRCSAPPRPAPGGRPPAASRTPFRRVLPRRAPLSFSIRVKRLLFPCCSLPPKTDYHKRACPASNRRLRTARQGVVGCSYFC